MINIEKLYRDFHIPYETPGHKHVGTGWIGTPCPFCTGNPGFHLGYCIDPTAKYAGCFSCWRCGGKPFKKAIAGILNIPESKIWEIVKQYSSEIPNLKEKPKAKRKARECKFPPGTNKMKASHRKYLKNRGYKPKELEKQWGLLGTGPIGAYKHRIIIPIYYQGNVVSYQGRDITNKSELKYKACKQKEEVIDHKNCLYGIDNVPDSSVVVTEGVADVWRLGPGAVATFGIKFKEEQAKLLLQFKNIFLLYDSENDDPQAGEQAEKLAWYVGSPDRHVEIIDLDEGDPGELTEEEARMLMADLIGKIKKV